MFFTSKEREAIALMGVAMQAADGKTDSYEIFANNAMFAKIQITQAEIQEAQAMQIQDAIPILSAMTNDKKEIVSAYLGALMVIDGDIAAAEVALWRFVSTMCLFPLMEISEAAEKFRKFLEQ